MKLGRLSRLLVIYGSILLIGLIYGIILIPRGIVINCVFSSLLGISCMGCGLTRACLSIMQGDIINAIKYNIGLFILNPLILYMFIDYNIKYIRNIEYKRPDKLILFLIIYSIIWVIIRNIFNI